MTQWPCKTSGCNQTVSYDPGDVDALIPFTRTDATITHEETDTVFLTCANGHTNPYP